MLQAMSVCMDATTVITNALKAIERKERAARIGKGSVTLSREQLQGMTTSEIYMALGVRPLDMGDGDHAGTSSALDDCVSTCVDLVPWETDIVFIDEEKEFA